MDTKSRKFKHTAFVKGICFFLSALLFFSSAYSVITFLIASSVYGFQNYLDGDYKSFPSCEAFLDRFLSDTEAVGTLANSNTDDISASLEQKKMEIVEEAVSNYLDTKANIIKEELEYAVEYYDDSYFSYEYTADSIDLPSSDPASGADSMPEAATSAEYSIPRNIQAAQQILENCSGRDFLNYETLVRSEAFGISFDYSVDSEEIILYGVPYTFSFYTTNMYYSEQQIKAEFLAQYANMAEQIDTDCLNRTDNALRQLSSLENFKFYAESKDGMSYSNTDGAETPDWKTVTSYSVYAVNDGTTVEVHGIDSDAVSDVQSLITGDNIKFVILYLTLDTDGTITGTDTDVYTQLLQAYQQYQQPSAKTYILVGALSLILSVIMLITLLCLCGHVNGRDECVTAYIDKLPNDLHFVLSFGLIAGTLVLTGFLLDSITPFTYRWFYYSDYFNGALGLSCTVCWMLLTEWLASTVRIKKAGKSWFRHTLLAYLFSAIGHFCKKIMRILTYKPGKFMRNILIAACAYILINSLLGFSIFFLYLPISILLILIFNIVCLMFILRYIKNLDKIITASTEHRNIDFSSETLPESLRILAVNLANANEEVAKAVEKAVKDEQMKTELITNVSHDLKTPLTSLISYSDLLDKCNIQDESAKRYIKVLNEQSVKLKRLIEDLIEASKVSTGNVTLNQSLLNLVELSSQAIAEFEPDMAKNGNTIVFNEPAAPPTIFADGSKTYRIISNLLSNAKKYSAPNTRVYISVYDDGVSGYFEIKNVSCEPLNISADELTERFVRGDKSRSREGNGLGLSIAKDLCTLQGGALKIIIDGDLFKAIVQLPSKQNMEWPADEELLEEPVPNSIEGVSDSTASVGETDE